MQERLSKFLGEGEEGNGVIYYVRFKKSRQEHKNAASNAKVRQRIPLQLLFSKVTCFKSSHHQCLIKRYE